MPDPIPKPSSQPSLVESFAEVEVLLKLAEDLDQSRDELRASLWRQQIDLMVVNLLLGVAIAIVWLPSSNVSDSLKYFVTGAASCFSMYSVGVWVPAARRTRFGLIRNQRTFFELVDLLRAVEPHVAQGAMFSFVEQTAFRIRLARFDIGPETSVRPGPAGPRSAIRIVSPNSHSNRSEELTPTP